MDALNPWKNDTAEAEAAVAEAAVAAVICAAGSSRRMDGIKKEYQPLPGKKMGKVAGLTVLGAAVSAFAAIPCIKTIVITVPADPETGEAAARKALPQQLLAGKNGTSIHFVSGGKNRRASVFNALSLLSNQSFANSSPGFVLIHDGARPWISLSLIERIIESAKIHHAAIPLVPLVETPKETDLPLDDAQTVFIKQHLRRSVVGCAQTPQGFAFPEIFAAHEQAAVHEDRTSVEFTDDAEIWACFCGPVAAIPGEMENRKITFVEDIC